MSTTVHFADFQSEIYADGLVGDVPLLPMTPEDMEEAARPLMSERTYAYVAGAAGGERTARSNRAAFDDWQIVPRHLRGVEDRDLSTELFGQRLRTPILLAPVGALGTVHADADVVTARVAAEFGVPMILSTLSCSPLEEVAQTWRRGDAAEGWFQLFLKT